MKYQVNTDSFEAAIMAVVQAFQENNPGISDSVKVSCEMRDGTKVSIKIGKPKAKRPGLSG